MTALPVRRAPSVNALSPGELTYETVGFDKVCIPVNAVIVAENELLFLETAQNLQDLKAVVIEKIGYVYFGRIHCRVVFLLKPRGPTAVIHAMKRLQPRAAIFLGFCKALQFRSRDSQGVSFEVGDVLIAETVLRKSSKYGEIESHPCSEYLVNVFEHGKFGWSPPKYRKQSAHVGSVVQMGDFAKNEKGTAIAEKSTKLDVLECCKDLNETEWISILGVTRTHRYNSNSSWEHYVAAVVGSFLMKVLQDDHVFAILGGENLESREHSALSLFAQQESFSITGYSVTSRCDVTQEQVQRQAETYWAQIKEAFNQGHFHSSHGMRRSQSEIGTNKPEHRRRMYCKNPEENNDEKNPYEEAVMEECAHQASTVRKPLSFEQESSLPSEGPQRLTLPPLLSNIKGISARAATRGAQQKMSNHAQASDSYLTSGMAVTMQAALLPLGTSLGGKGSSFEIIRVTSEERATVSGQGRVLPPIPRGPNKV